MFHQVNANVLDKSRRELARKHPLWKGDVESAKQAIEAAHKLLGPIFEGEPRADSIVLHILPEKGGAIMSTEYAEDWRIGKGASLGDSLLAQNADHGLTPEEVDAAQKALTQRAVAAMPSIAKKVVEAKDPLRDFFGGTLPSERKSEEELSEEPVSVHVVHDSIFVDVMQKEVEEHFADAADDERRIFRETVKRVADKQDAARKGSSVIHGGGTIGHREFSLSDLMDAAEQIKRAVGVNPSEIVMGREAYESMKRMMSPKPGTEINDFQGMKIRVNDAKDAPPIQMVPKPRNLGPGKVYVKRADDVSWTAISEVQDFKLDVESRKEMKARMLGTPNTSGRSFYEAAADYLLRNPCKWQFNP